jgi:hypothetical protein
MAANHETSETGKTIEMPAPTGWPLLAAAGATLALSGLVTSSMVSAVGVFLFVASAVGWFRDVLPHERHERIPLVPEPLRARAVVPVPQKVEHLSVGAAQHRMRIPVEIHPYSAGIRGGIVGGMVMAILAVLFGLISHKSPWYPINLLAAAALPSLAAAPTSTLEAFQPVGLLVASLIHGAVSVIVGLLYALILPMVPGHPMFAGGLVGPLLWTGIVWASLGIVNPTLEARIEWSWFIVSQIGFGLVAGSIVARTEKIATLQTAPFVARAGIETGGVDSDEGRTR